MVQLSPQVAQRKAETREKAYKFRIAGFSYREIGKMMGKCSAWAWKAVKRYKSEHKIDK